MKIEQMKALIAGAEASLQTVLDDKNFQRISGEIDVDLAPIIQSLSSVYEVIDSQTYSEVEQKVENIFDLLGTK